MSRAQLFFWELSQTRLTSVLGWSSANTVLCAQLSPEISTLVVNGPIDFTCQIHSACCMLTPAPKVQAMVFRILPSTTAIFGYTVGLSKTVSSTAEVAVSLYHTTQSASFCYSCSEQSYQHRLILHCWNRDGTVSFLEWMPLMFTLGEGHCLVLCTVSVYQKRQHFVERLESCVKTN